VGNIARIGKTVPIVTIIFALASLAVGRSAAAQNTVTSTDLQRLQDTIYDTARDISMLRSVDSQLAAQLQAELDDARDEATYLRVKQQRNERVSSSDLSELRNKIEAIRTRARGEPVDRNRDSVAPVGSTGSVEDVPGGTEIDVRLQTPLSSKTAQAEDRVEATTVVDLMRGGEMIIPAGSVLHGVVSSVQPAGRIERTGRLTLTFDRMTIHGHNYPIRATVVGAIESEGIKGEKEKIGAGAGVGAIIGGILGGFKGALAGILIGGGGTIAATEGNDVELPPGAVLRVRLDSGLDISR
jgi:hypothetical protein